MLKKTITYKDFNDEEVSEDFYFHLNKAELIELEMGHQGGLQEALKKIIAAEDGKAIIAEFKNIILGSYGERSADGKRFIKNQQLRDEFESSEAYSELFLQLVTDADAAAEFVRGIIPKDLVDERTSSIPGIAAVPSPAEEPEPTKPSISQRDLQQLPQEEFKTMMTRIQNGDVILVES